MNQTHPATFAPAGSSRGGQGSNELPEALDGKGSCIVTGNGVPRQRVEYDYTPEGKRINKRVYAWNAGSFVLEYQLRYIWHGWNMIAELNPTNHAIIRYYGWGPDVSGSISGAGGVGGLLWCTEGLETYYYGHDGNGNVTVMVNAFEGTVAGMYEYGPFGETIRATGPMAKVNPFRFSTKYQDEETDLLYYGYRYYNASTGRWLSRDPIEEEGGVNLYGFTFNSPTCLIDLLGQRPLTYEEWGIYSTGE